MAAAPQSSTWPGQGNARVRSGSRHVEFHDVDGEVRTGTAAKRAISSGAYRIVVGMDGNNVEITRETNEDDVKLLTKGPPKYIEGEADPTKVRPYEVKAETGALPREAAGAQIVGWVGRKATVMREWLGRQCGEGYVNVFPGQTIKFEQEPTQFSYNNEAIENWLILGVREGGNMESVIGWVPLLVFYSDEAIKEIAGGAPGEGVVVSNETFAIINGERTRYYVDACKDPQNPHAKGVYHPKDLKTPEAKSGSHWRSNSGRWVRYALEAARRPWPTSS